MEPALILQTFAKVRRLIRGRISNQLKTLDLGSTQGILLRNIRAQGNCSLADLSRETLTDPALTGKTIDSLIRQGWVKKTEHPKDRRRWVVSLTRDGEKMARKLDPIWEQIAGEFVEGFSITERKEFHRLLLKAETTLEAKNI